jgi:hypothetical protein
MSVEQQFPRDVQSSAPAGGEPGGWSDSLHLMVGMEAGG